MDYIVKKGDTLWDISERFYLDPFLLPKLWQQNQYVTNPHWIFPGDRIRLYPYRILIKGIEPVKEALPRVAGPPLPPIPKTLPLTRFPEVFPSGFIADDEKGIGVIVAARDSMLMLAEGHEVYLTFREDIPVAKEDMYTIFRVEGPMIHPVTHKPIGFKVLILGLVKILQDEGQVKTGMITMSYDPIERGDLLRAFIPPSQDLAIKMTEKRRYGWIIASRGTQRDLVEGDIVYIDGGKETGLEPGHIFDVFRAGDWTMDPLSQQKVKLPDDLIGRLVVLSTQQRTATAIITASRSPISVGDEIVSIAE